MSSTGNTLMYTRVNIRLKDIRDDLFREKAT